MSNNFTYKDATLTTGTGAADEVTDGILGVVKVPYVKIMDGTEDGTSKAAVGANGLAVDVKAAVITSGTITTVGAVTAITNALPAGSNAIGMVTAVGAAASGAAVSGNPVYVGLQGRSSLQSNVTNGQAVGQAGDRNGRAQFVKPNMPTASSAGTAITTNTNTSIVAAPSAGNHLRIYRLWAQNSSATGTWCYWGNGSGVKTLPFYLAQNQPFSMNVEGEWELSTATALFMNTATTGANIEWFVQYETITD